jgi:hypothetical protein
MSEIPEQVREFLREIGRKGGRANKGTARRRELSKINARLRWDKAKARANGGQKKP